MNLAQIKDIVQDLFKIMVVTSHYDISGRPSKEVLSNSLYVPPIIALVRPNCAIPLSESCGR